MNSKRNRTWSTIFMLFVSAALISCTVVVTPATVSAGVVVNAPPPQLIVETRTVAPGSNYIWIEGYWSWQGSQWVWMQGHWEVVRVGYFWVVPHYEYKNGGHYYVAGGWIKDEGYKGKGSNQGYSTGKGSNKGYKTSAPKCPQGYAWVNNACRYQSK